MPSSLLSSYRRWKASLVSYALETGTGSHCQLNNSRHGTLAPFQRDSGGKTDPPFKGNNLGLHSLEMFTHLNPQIKMAEFQPTFIKIIS